MGICPYPACSAGFGLFIGEEDGSNNRFAECLECRRGMYLKCKATWHKGMFVCVCAADHCIYLRIGQCTNETGGWVRWQRPPGDETSKIVGLPEDNRWTRCPQCCYRCGAVRCGAISSGHACSRNCATTLSGKNNLRDAREPMFQHYGRPVVGQFLSSSLTVSIYS
ncbi:hypothetical protein BX666DRAFT_179646 [Dichotomocladium elegans]|nr:hypothetical protein BX666DRAFT_179646 [Dichotomocladium elegans]